MYLLVTTFGVLLASLIATYYFLWPSTSAVQKKSFQVVVLGDIGRSPRMQYHALSIAQHGGSVDVVGFLESDPLSELKRHPAVHFSGLPTPPKFLNTSNKALFLFAAPLKVLFQALSLWRVLAVTSHTSEWMLVQNPPSIPILGLAVLVCHFRKTKLVIDWHNFGYSILALKLGGSHPLVKISKAYEIYLAQYADAHFAVTNAMCHLLKSSFRLKSPVFALHDRPAPIFVPLSEPDRAVFIARHELTAAAAPAILTKQTRVLVSATSWTADEDFSVLIEALRSYSASAISGSPQLPELLVVITGKGPLRQYYLNRIRQLEQNQELKMVTIKTAWLSFEDYALLLGAADIGISLHTSSSGVDLPMKVVDMFGAGLPVLGYHNFKAWPELVTENVNGQGFANASEMSDKLKYLLNPANDALERLRQGALKESKRRWESVWNPVAGKMLGLAG